MKDILDSEDKNTKNEKELSTSKKKDLTSEESIESPDEAVVDSKIELEEKVASTPRQEPININPKERGQAISNFKDVKEQYNVGNLYGDINFGEKTNKFNDHTKPISNFSADYFDLNTIVDWEEKTEQFKKQRVVTIAFPGLKKLESIVENFLNDNLFNGLDRIGLFFTEEVINDSKFQFQSLINEKIGKGKDNIILVYLSEQYFLDSMMINSGHEAIDSFADSISLSLKNSNSYIICLVSEIDLIERLAEKSTLFPFLLWEISWLRTMLLGHLSREVAFIYEEKLLEIGIDKNDAKYHDYIDNLLKKEGLKGLDREVEKIKKLVKEGLLLNEAIFNGLNVLTPNQILEKEGEIIKHICFIATYFSNLSVDEFRNLVSAFLRNKQEIVIIEKKRKTKKGKIKLPLKEEIIVKAIEKWNSSADDLLKRAKLQATLNANGKKVIDFTEPFLRQSFYKYFERENSNYFSDSFHFLLYENNILFNLKTPKSILENFTKLFAKLTSKEPDYYGREKLFLHTIGIGNLNLPEKKIENKLELVETLIGTLKLENFRREAFFRISKLIQEMLDYFELKTVIDGYFNSLLQHNPIIALRIIEFLRFSDKFDKFYWFRQLIDRGGKEALISIQKGLIKIIQNSSQFKTFDYLEIIKDWHPENGKENFSPSNYVSLSFLLDYSISTINDINYNEYGKWPTKYQLFASFSKDKQEITIKIDFILSWLLHPSMRKAKEYTVVVDASDFDFLLSAIIEQWYQILVNLDQPTSEGKKIANILIFRLKLLLNAKQQKVFRNNWNKTKNKLFERMKGLSKSKLSYRERKFKKSLFKKRRDVLKQMISEFKSINQ